MNLGTKRKIVELEKMTTGQMRQKYRQLFDEDTRSSNRRWLFKRLAWRIQSLDQGGLSQRAVNRAREIARDEDIRIRPPKEFVYLEPAPPQDSSINAPEHLLRHRDPRLPMPGTVINRQFKGRNYQVKVMPKGFEFEGENFRSLSAIAQKITGSRWNGFVFFKLDKGSK